MQCSIVLRYFICRYCIDTGTPNINVLLNTLCSENTTNRTTHLMHQHHPEITLAEQMKSAQKKNRPTLDTKSNVLILKAGHN